MSSEVVCMALGRVPVGEQRCRFLAVGLSDNTVRIISLDPSVSPQKSSTFFYKSFFSCIYMLQVIFKYSFSLSSQLQQNTKKNSTCIYMLYLHWFKELCFIWQDCLSPLSMQALPEPSESLCIVEMGGTEAKEETGEPGTVGGLFLNIGLQVLLDLLILLFTCTTCKIELLRSLHYPRFLMKEEICLSLWPVIWCYYPCFNWKALITT